MDTPTLDYRRYMWLSLVSFSIVLLAAALLNYFIDPYDLFGTKRIDGINAVKPSAGKHVRLSKPYMVSRFSPRTIIGGNSRPELGLNPLSTCWTNESQPAFNIGIPGAGIFMQARMLQHAIASGPEQKKHVLWGLDFMDFLNRHSNQEDGEIWPRSNYDFEDRLSVTATGQPNIKQPRKKLQDSISTLFSIDTVEDSLYTLFSQGNDHSANRSPNGFNPALDYLDLIDQEGQQVLFLKKNKELANSFSRTKLSIFGDGNQWSYEFETVSQTLRYLKQRNIKVALFINPYHVDYLTLIALTGRWKEFEQWKRQLQRLAERNDVILWDFAILNKFTMEQPPYEGDKNITLKWFWEPAHYKAKYGDLMLQQILGKSCLPQGLKTVGIQLRPDIIGSHLEHERDTMNLYSINSAGLLAKLRSYLPGP